MNFKAKDIILFTGAGFTKNFGGFLGSEMWSLIFSHPLVQDHEKLKDLLSTELNYEYAYNIVLDSTIYNEKEKSAIKQVVEDAYKKLDDHIKNWTFNNNDPNSLNISALGKFLKLFAGSGQEKGCIFTLNQDIFMERKFKCSPLDMPRIFPIPLDFTKEHFQRTPNASDIKSDMNNCGDRIYIKLHGSYGWLSLKGENQMVIGGDKFKLECINDEPLLKRYFDIFEKVINQGNKKIVIVGYGFNDNHINSFLFEGVKNHNLKFYIINPTDPNKFRSKVEGLFSGKDFAIFWKGMGGYFPYTLLDIFPHDQSQDPTVLLQSIKEAIIPK